MGQMIRQPIRLQKYHLNCIGIPDGGHGYCDAKVGLELKLMAGGVIHLARPMVVTVQGLAPGVDFAARVGPRFLEGREGLLNQGEWPSS